MSTLIKAFPASNTTDWGRVLTEQNLKSILGYLQTKTPYEALKYTNAVTTGFDLTNMGTIAGTSIEISEGSALFEGYIIETLLSGSTSKYSNIFYPNQGDGTYYIALHLKYTTGATIGNFIECSDFKDYGRTSEPYTGTQSYDTTTSDCPIVIIKKLSIWGEGSIPNDLGLSSIQSGYIYKYLVLYTVTVENGVMSVQDNRSRDFLPLHEITVGYTDNDVSHYYGLANATMSTTDQKTIDWRNKFVVSKSGTLDSLESVLFNYFAFIHKTVRGYNYTGYDLESLTPSNIESINWGTTTSGLENFYGECLPIQNITTPSDSLMGKVSYSHFTTEADTITRGNSSVLGVPKHYITDYIITPVKATVDSVTTYSYTTPEAPLGYIPTLNAEGVIPSLFLPKASTDEFGAIKINTDYSPDASAVDQNSPIFTITAGVLSTAAARYSFTQIRKGVSVIISASNNNDYINLDSTAINGFSKPFEFIQGEDAHTVSIHQIAPVAGATYLTDRMGSGTYYINQNVETTSDVTLGSLITSSIEAPDSNLTITADNVTVTGTLTASKVYNAVYNDYAELFKKSDINETIEPGDVIVKTESGYAKSNCSEALQVIGVVSDSYGMLLGGNPDNTIEQNLKEYIPVGLAGRVRVKVVGKASIGDLLTSSDLKGVAKVVTNFKPGIVIGKCLSNKTNTEVGKVEMLVLYC